jgi:hypothetical protein
VIGREQRVLEFALAAFEACPVKQPMRVERVPDTRALAERESDGGTTLADQRVAGRKFRGRRAVLASDVLEDVLAFGRHVRIQFERLNLQVAGGIVADASARSRAS